MAKPSSFGNHGPPGAGSGTVIVGPSSASSESSESSSVSTSRPALRPGAHRRAAKDDAVRVHIGQHPGSVDANMTMSVSAAKADSARWLTPVTGFLQDVAGTSNRANGITKGPAQVGAGRSSAAEVSPQGSSVDRTIPTFSIRYRSNSNSVFVNAISSDARHGVHGSSPQPQHR